MRARPISIAALAVPVAAVLLLAGCSTAGSAGSSSSSGAAASKAPATTASVASKPVPSNPCDLLTLAEASKAVGAPVTGTLHQGTSCSYNSEDYGFAIDLYPKGGDDQWQINLIGMKAQFSKTPSISGLGDRAAGIGGYLVVQSGSTVFQVEDTYADKDPQLAHATAVAKAVLSKL